MTTATPWPATTRRLARSLGILAIPLALWVLLLLAVSDPLRLWVHGQEEYDVAALKEWLEEARGSGESLPELVRSFLARVEALQRLPDNDVNRIPIDAFVAAGDKGIVHAGVGDGSLARPAVEPALIDARKKGVIVVRSSRVGNGIVARNGEAKDDELDFVVSDTLSPQKARILLMLALTKTNDTKAIQQMFYTY